MQINPQINPYKPEDVEVDVMVRERPPMTVEVGLGIWEAKCRERDSCCKGRGYCTFSLFLQPSLGAAPQKKLGGKA